MIGFARFGEGPGQQKPRIGLLDRAACEIQRPAEVFRGATGIFVFELFCLAGPDVSGKVGLEQASAKGLRPGTVFPREQQPILYHSTDKDNLRILIFMRSAQRLCGACFLQLDALQAQ